MSEQRTLELRLGLEGDFAGLTAEQLEEEMALYGVAEALQMHDLDVQWSEAGWSA